MIPTSKSIEFPLQTAIGKVQYKRRNKDISRFIFMMLTAMILQLLSIFYYDFWIQQHWAILDIGVFGVSGSLLKLNFNFDCRLLREIPLVNTVPLEQSCYAQHDLMYNLTFEELRDNSCQPKSSNTFLKFRCSTISSLYNASANLLGAVIASTLVLLLLVMFSFLSFFQFRLHAQNARRNLIIIVSVLNSFQTPYRIYQYIVESATSENLVYPIEQAGYSITIPLHKYSNESYPCYILIAGFFIQLLSVGLSFGLPKDEQLILDYNRRLAELLLVYSSSFDAEYYYRNGKKANEKYITYSDKYIKSRVKNDKKTKSTFMYVPIVSSNPTPFTVGLNGRAKFSEYRNDHGAYWWSTLPFSQLILKMFQKSNKFKNLVDKPVRYAHEEYSSDDSDGERERVYLK